MTWSPPIGGHLEQECAGRGGEVARPLEDAGLQLAAAQHGTEQPGLHTLTLSYRDTCQMALVILTRVYSYSYRGTCHAAAPVVATAMMSCSWLLQFICGCMSCVDI